MESEKLHMSSPEENSETNNEGNSETPEAQDHVLDVDSMPAASLTDLENQTEAPELEYEEPKTPEALAVNEFGKKEGSVFGDIYERIKNEVQKRKLVLAAMSLLSLGSVGCQVQTGGNGQNFAQNFIGSIEQANAYARAQPPQVIEQYQHYANYSLGVGGSAGRSGVQYGAYAQSQESTSDYRVQNNFFNNTAKIQSYNQFNQQTIVRNSNHR